MPDGWSARVWARVPGARMEAWTPEGDLLVSEPGSGRVAELTPRSGGTAASRILLSGLTSPQGLAFARLAGRWVLYVGEADQIDRCPWGAGGISGTRTVVAARLPDLDPTAAAGAAPSTPYPDPTAPCTSATTPPAPSTA